MLQEYKGVILLSKTRALLLTPEMLILWLLKVGVGKDRGLTRPEPLRSETQGPNPRTKLPLRVFLH